ncbi:hypothetical protein B0H14DRAFT_2567086 [Mycena olivaceomarginata]|nr:hypothetical protein B0H14DRAFT_2567086 [Mycena olivaceomarginata]
MPPWKEDPEVASKLLKRGRLVAPRASSAREGGECLRACGRGPPSLTALREVLDPLATHQGKYNQNHWQRSIGREEEGFIWVLSVTAPAHAYGGSKANGMAPPTLEPTPMSPRVSWASTTRTSTTCASTSCLGSTSPSTDIDALRQSQLHMSSTCTMQSTVRARLRRSSDVARASEPASNVSPDSIPHAAAFPSPHGKLTRHRSPPLFKTKIATAQCSCMIAGVTKVPHGARKE